LNLDSSSHTYKKPKGKSIQNRKNGSSSIKQKAKNKITTTHDIAKRYLKTNIKDE
jgi:hypothetical protein